MIDDRGYRYGDGLFETMKLVNGKLLLEDYHFERLFSSLQLFRLRCPQTLDYGKVTAGYTTAGGKKSMYLALARIRLSISRGNGGLYDKDWQPDYLVECWPLNPAVQINLTRTVSPLGSIRPPPSSATSLPTPNLPISCHSLAAHYAQQQRWNDCLVLNTRGNMQMPLLPMFSGSKMKISIHRHYLKAAWLVS